MWYIHTMEYIYIHIHTYIYVCVCICIYISSVQFICSVMSNSLWPHELQHARPPCPSPIPGVYSNSCPLSWWCHPAISSSVIPFSSCPQSLPASGSFPVSQLFAWGGQSIIYILSNKKEPATDKWSNLNESPGNYAEWIRSIKHGNIQYCAIYIIFFKMTKW